MIEERYEMGWVEQDENTVPDTLPRECDTEIYIKLWPKCRIEENISYGNKVGDSPFSMLIVITSIGEYIQLQVGP